MIIKSMSRKSKSFSQLYDYLLRDKDSFSFTRNAYSNSINKKELIKEFLENYSYLKNSRGRVSLYHELLSLETNNLSFEKQKEILLDLANKYLEIRANNHLSLGVMHKDKEHIHIHLMISSNELNGDKRVRLSKKEFSNIQKTLEDYKNERYKELSQTKLYQNTKETSFEKRKEQEIKHKRNTKTIKDQIKIDLQKSFSNASSKIYLNNHLKNLGFKIYNRGQNIGVIYENKKYRLKTLGLEKEYEKTLIKLEKIKDRELRRAKVKEDRTFQRWRNKRSK